MKIIKMAIVMAPGYAQYIKDLAGSCMGPADRISNPHVVICSSSDLTDSHLDMLGQQAYVWTKYGLQFGKTALLTVDAHTRSCVRHPHIVMSKDELADPGAVMDILESCDSNPLALGKPFKAWKVETRVVGTVGALVRCNGDNPRWVFDKTILNQMCLRELWNLGNMSDRWDERPQAEPYAPYVEGTGETCQGRD